MRMTLHRRPPHHLTQTPTHIHGTEGIWLYDLFRPPRGTTSCFGFGIQLTHSIVENNGNFVGRGQGTLLYVRVLPPSPKKKFLTF